MDQIAETTGILLLFNIWKNDIENCFKNEDDDGNWLQWKQTLKLTECNNVEGALENPGGKKQLIELWKVEDLI